MIFRRTYMCVCVYITKIPNSKVAKFIFLHKIRTFNKNIMERLHFRQNFKHIFHLSHIVIWLVNYNDFDVHFNSQFLDETQDPWTLKKNIYAPLWNIPNRFILLIIVIRLIIVNFLCKINQLIRDFHKKHLRITTLKFKNFISQTSLYSYLKLFLALLFTLQWSYLTNNC